MCQKKSITYGPILRSFHKNTRPRARPPRYCPVVIGKVPKQRAVGPYHTNEKARSHTRPLAFSYLKALSPAGDHSDAIPTGTSFQAPTRPPARELHGAGPTSDPALHPLPASTPAPPVAGHPFPRPHSKPHSEQQKLANFSCADIIKSDTS